MSYALITGASSGIGEEFARVLSRDGYDLILVARREDRLLKLKESLNTNVIVYPMDISEIDNCYKLMDSIKDLDVKVFINNAGFGDCGYILETDINRELNMIDLNVKALYLLTKLALKSFEVSILNVASFAGILYAGPYMSQYYATKAYVRSFSEGISYELRKNKSKSRVSVLCPGPVKTEFDSAANVNFSLKGMKVSKCVKYAYKKFKKKKVVIIPGASIRLASFGTRFTPRGMANGICARQQKKKL